MCEPRKDTDMHSSAHPVESKNRSTYGTSGLVFDWGWRYDLMIWVGNLALCGKWNTVIKKVVDLAQVQKGDVVLDVGCGTGTLAILVKEHVGNEGRVYGIDPGPKQIARARSKAEKAGLSIDFRLGMIEQLAFPDQSLDIVLSTVMMHHLPDDVKRQGLKEIMRVLKPGGRLLVLDSTDRVGPWNSSLYDLPALMEDAGFSHTDVGDVGFMKLGFVLARKE